MRYYWGKTPKWMEFVAEIGLTFSVTPWVAALLLWWTEGDAFVLAVMGGVLFMAAGEIGKTSRSILFLWSGLLAHTFLSNQVAWCMAKQVTKGTGREFLDARLVKDRSLKLISLCGENERPYAFIVWGRPSQVEFLEQVRKELQDSDDDLHDLSAEAGEMWKISTGWGRFKKVEGWYALPRDFIFSGDGWPIPFLNQRYTKATRETLRK